MTSKYRRKSLCLADILLRMTSTAENDINLRIPNRTLALTQGGLSVGDVRVRSDGLVLAVDENPKADLVFAVVEVVGDAALEDAVSLLLEPAEAG